MSVADLTQHIAAAVAKRAVEKTKAEVEFLDELRAAGIEA
jgi:hypothetical protein